MAGRARSGRLAAYLPTVALAASVAACAPPVAVRTVEVPVPIDRPVLPPQSLTEPVQVPPVLWMAPEDPRATSCLSAEGEQALRALLIEIRKRQAALKAWRKAADVPHGTSQEPP